MFGNCLLIGCQCWTATHCWRHFKWCSLNTSSCVVSSLATRLQPFKRCVSDHLSLSFSTYSNGLVVIVVGALICRLTDCNLSLECCVMMFINFYIAGSTYFLIFMYSCSVTDFIKQICCGYSGFVDEYNGYVTRKWKQHYWLLKSQIMDHWRFKWHCCML